MILAQENDVEVVNFATRGPASSAVCQRIYGALRFRTPDLILLYSGHNDYGTAYQWERRAHFSIVPPWAIKALGFNEHIRVHRIEPFIAKSATGIGLLRLDNVRFRKLDQHVVRDFARNIELLVEWTQDQRIPLVLITPVSNLYSPPIGVDGEARKQYQGGLAATDYEQRIKLLRRARDLDAFTGDIRAKSGLRTYLLSLKKQGVHVLDLEEALIQQRFGFGPEDFYDHLHLRPKAHELIAEILTGWLKEKGLCCRAR